MFAKLSAIAVMVLAGAAFACDCVTFSNATASFASPTVGVGYVTITSDNDDTLTGVSSPCCAAIELHESTMQGDVMQMRKLDSLALKTGEPMVIGGDTGMGNDSMHLMLIGPHKHYKTGDKIPVTFHFAKTGDHASHLRVGGKAKPISHHH